MFIIYIAALKINTKLNYIKKIMILIKYLNYINIFLLKFATKLLEFNNNNYIFRLKKGK